jgi:hypothetical protein
MSAAMYKSIDIWKRLDGKTLVRYRCFEILASNRFCVQSSDYYHLPLDVSQLAQSDRQFLELLIEEAPEARAETYLTLEEAIRMHDLEFGNQ